MQLTLWGGFLVTHFQINKYMNASKKQITKYNLRREGKRLTTILKKIFIAKITLIRYTQNDKNLWALDREIDLKLVLLCHDCLDNLPAKMQWKNSFLKKVDKIILHVNCKSVLCHVKLAGIGIFCIPKGLWDYGVWHFWMVQYLTVQLISS